MKHALTFKPNFISNTMQKDFRIHKVLSYWALRIVPAVILIQSLLYKFGDDAESVYIFTTTGLGDDVRLLIAVFEFIAAFFFSVPTSFQRRSKNFYCYYHIFVICPFIYRRRRSACRGRLF